VIFFLFVASTIFWSSFEQDGSTLNLFAKCCVRTDLFGFSFPASWLQSVNPILVVMLSPVFAWLWTWLGAKNPSIPAKFALALGFAGMGMLLLVPTALRGGQISPLWPIATYTMFTIGELSLSPIGQNAIAQLAPARISSLMMGVWFLAGAAGRYLAGQFSSHLGFNEDSPRIMHLPYAKIFAISGLSAALSGVALMIMIRPIKRLMSDLR
jgi:POT family proton-dependent oligopeptide transporter